MNGTNVGVGLIGLQLEVEVDGVAPDPVTVPVFSLVAGGVVNPIRGPDERAIQSPDRIKFTMVPGRGLGLSYRLVVRDLFRFVHLPVVVVCATCFACVHEATPWRHWGRGGGMVPTVALAVVLA